MGFVDLGFGAASVLAAAVPPAEIVMIPMDVTSFTLTMGMYQIIRQSLTSSCDNIRWKWPWE